MAYCSSVIFTGDLNPACCPVFNPDGSITLQDVSGNTQTFTPGVLGISADAGNMLSLGADNLPFIDLAAVSLAASNEIPDVTMLDAFGVPIGYYLPL